jgi:orotidine-5'-phosphate decarboxylase
MNLQPIVDDIADRADDFLDGVSSRAQAKAGISEVITVDYRTLSPGERAKVIDQVMLVLEREGFFDALRGSPRDDEVGEADAGD